MPDPHIVADRATFDHAADLLALFGADAGLEAASRASRSRDVGNVFHYCRWRLVELLVDALISDEVAGTVH